MMGTRGTRGPVSPERFAAQWQDPAVGAELRELGIERPEQLGALFLGDAAEIARLTAGAAPLIDDRPARVMAQGPFDFRGWFDTRRAAARFEASPLVARL